MLLKENENQNESKKSYVRRTIPLQSSLPTNCGVKDSKNIQRCRKLCKCYLHLEPFNTVCFYCEVLHSLSGIVANKDDLFEACCLIGRIEFLHEQFPNDFCLTCYGY